MPHDRRGFGACTLGEYLKSRSALSCSRLLSWSSMALHCLGKTNGLTEYCWEVRLPHVKVLLTSYFTSFCNAFMRQG